MFLHDRVGVQELPVADLTNVHHFGGGHLPKFAFVVVHVHVVLDPEK